MNVWGSIRRLCIMFQPQLVACCDPFPYQALGTVMIASWESLCTWTSSIGLHIFSSYLRYPPKLLKSWSRCPRKYISDKCSSHREEYNSVNVLQQSWPAERMEIEQINVLVQKMITSWPSKLSMRPRGVKKWNPLIYTNAARKWHASRFFATKIVAVATEANMWFLFEQIHQKNLLGLPLPCCDWLRTQNHYWRLTSVIHPYLWDNYTSK